MSATESLKTGKNIIKDYLREMHENYGFPKEIVSNYDVVDSGPDFAIFRFHRLIVDLIETEVSANNVKEKFKFQFFESDGINCVRLESNGFECYIIAGLLAKIVSVLKEVRRGKK